MSALQRTERQWQAEVIELAHILGWRVAHFRPLMNRRGYWRTPVQGDGAGFPDLVLVRDRIIAAELKSKRGKVADEQQAWLDAFAGAGAESHVWRPDDLDELPRILRRPKGRAS